MDFTLIHFEDIAVRAHEGEDHTIAITFSCTRCGDVLVYREFVATEATVNDVDQVRQQDWDCALQHICDSTTAH